ncbi:hypothetical protein Z946_2198 [Sulfitobacter noctilucicola]|uniref:Outer membrane protein beta-barrel domain-containing protein n=1 Tax=Sulfitobacter noctilucicola TaxID=1342301 RepID=A0A7W6MA16_9RHOB|nr:hypothetical protein [Sulfitobacter noctilucicola]KIN63328.1 hypothetical protein Z946_2198 [Sulfitobacter noctilucicola]MBB4175154.1 hypothetical protein [Sulfitobacter noctilucicola]
MRFGWVLILAVWMMSVSTASAGAWLREEATGFVSLSFGATQFSETTNGLYLEYGVSPKTTVGLDISTFTNSQNVRNGFGNLFLRRALGPSDKPSKFSYEIGIGGLWGNEMQRPTLKSGLSWGRGFQVKDRNGWVNIDGAFVYEPTLGEHITKLDGTLGIGFSQLTTGLFEVNISHQNEELYGAFEPSVLFKPAKSLFQIKVGAQIPFEEQKKTALKLGIWHNF